MQATLTELSTERVNRAVEAILSVLGAPETELHREALAAFKKGDYQHVKRLAAKNLNDYFCKTLGYLGGALKLTPNTDTILAESARAAADHNREVTLKSLGAAILNALDESA